MLSNPWSGLLQGAGEYLRYTAGRRGLDPDRARELREFLDRWDGRTLTSSRR
ncbi:hypothetical protein [Amycolatopsis coloradensis]|uniref:hypothetical protein n=1 Tax=Amycolatopsis coloradensis TaxID=76021 RepID=UPI00130179D9|nr:hypothetical protein [Amycolatopsis coloradensis]